VRGRVAPPRARRGPLPTGCSTRARGFAPRVSRDERRTRERPAGGRRPVDPPRGRPDAAPGVEGLPPALVRNRHLCDRQPDHDGRDPVSGLRADALDARRRAAVDRRARSDPDGAALRGRGRGRGRPAAAPAPLGYRPRARLGGAARQRAAPAPARLGPLPCRGALDRRVRLPAAGAERAHPAPRPGRPADGGDCRRGHGVQPRARRRGRSAAS
jgi:hypothetical protein